MLAVSKANLTVGMFVCGQGGMCWMIKGGAGWSLPHGCTNLWQKRPPAQGTFWLQARCHNLSGARAAIIGLDYSNLDEAEANPHWLASEADHPTKKIGSRKTCIKIYSRSVKVACA
ncbi:hypothetical protein O181_132696 [Austropuccinia psidii MF-1]|uniref:Uncharacterized protein n=1 Tax=Austropuccinia psidii MF-1 TaxID=1389203 RepID=A0A9Q3L6B8_9BASI|nr:hypothetical protein [Austropuccinia psidii MF-1]